MAITEHTWKLQDLREPRLSRKHKSTVPQAPQAPLVADEFESRLQGPQAWLEACAEGRISQCERITPLLAFSRLVGSA